MSDEDLEEMDKPEEMKTEKDPSQVVNLNLVSCFDEEVVVGTSQLWKQSIIYPTPHWKNAQIEGKLTGFLADEAFGEGDSLHNLSRLGIIIRGLMQDLT
jgi:hypothetical protein